MIIFEFLDGSAMTVAEVSCAIGVRDSDQQRPIRAIVTEEMSDKELYRIATMLHGNPKYNAHIEYVPT
jgi:hypothetical protein